MSRQQFSLRWNNYLRHVTNAFDALRCQEDLVDVTLCCEGKKIRAHKMLLSACSTYFKDIFKENPCQHPVIIFRNVRYEDLWAIINFIYHGEVNIVQEQLASFLTTAELLEVQGLTDGTDDKNNEGINELEIRGQNDSSENDISNTIFQAKKRKLSLKRHPDLDVNTLEHNPDIGIVSIDAVDSENFKLEAVENLEEPNIQLIESNIPSNSVVSFPEEIEICDSEVFQTTNLLNDLKAPDCNPTNIDNAQDIGVDSALKDTSQGLLDWNGLLSTQNDVAGNLNLVTLSSGISPIKEMRTFQFDTKIVNLNSENLIKVLSCNICDKVFTHPHSLTHHRKSHNGETQCHICPKTYTRAYDLKRHIRTSHSNPVVDHVYEKNK